MIANRFLQGLGALLLPLLIMMLGGNVCMAQELPAPKPSPDQLYYDAVKARMLGEDKLSEDLLHQVIALNPDDPAPYYDLSRLAMKANNVDGAASSIKKAIALDGTNKWYREQYANVLALRNDFAGAAAEYAAIAKTEKFNDTYLEKSALLYQRAGRFREALDQLDVLKAKSGDNEVLLQQQQVYLKMNDVAGAARVVRELINRNPKDSRYYSLLIDIYENNKLPKQAAEVLLEMQEKFPADPSLQLALASQALKKGDTSTYNSYVRKTITNKELDPETQLMLLRPYLVALPNDSVQRTEALQLIGQLMQQHPNNVEVLMTYGQILLFNNQRTKAAEQYQRAIELNPNNFNSWQQLLISYTGRADADSLIKWSEKAARFFPNQALVHYFNGIGHYNKKDYKPAIRSLNRAIDLEPEEKGEELSDIFTTLGDVYNTIKEYKLSDSAYNAALRLNPRNPTVLNNYAYYLSVRNVRLEDAARMSKESLDIRPGESTFLDTYGWILYQQGKYKEALSYIQKAIDSSPEEADPTLWEHLGAILYKMSDKDGAVSAWKKAKAKGSENENIDKMIGERKLYE